MKFALAFAATFAALTGCATQPSTQSHTHTTPDSTAQRAKAEIPGADDQLPAGTVEARVDGLSCPLCAESLRAVMRRVEGVESIRLNLDKGTVAIRIGEPRPTRAQVAQAIDDAGFTFIGFVAK